MYTYYGNSIHSNSSVTIIITELSITLTCTCRMEDYEEADPPIVLQQNDAYSTQVQLQNVASSSENHQQQLQYVYPTLYFIY